MKELRCHSGVLYLAQLAFGVDHSLLRGAILCPQLLLMKCHRIHAVVKTQMCLAIAVCPQRIVLVRDIGVIWEGLAIVKVESQSKKQVCGSLQHLAQRHHCGDCLYHPGLLQLTGLVTFLPVRLAIGHLCPSCSRDDRNGTPPLPLPPLHHPGG